MNAAAATLAAVNSEHEASFFDASAAPVSVIRLPIPHIATPSPFAPEPGTVGILGFIYPGKGHEDLIAALRADAADDAGGAPMPIILMTAASPALARAAGADAILRKPFDLTQLEALLERFLGHA